MAETAKMAARNNVLRMLSQKYGSTKLRQRNYADYIIEIKKSFLRLRVYESKISNYRRTS